MSVLVRTTNSKIDVDGTVNVSGVSIFQGSQDHDDYRLRLGDGNDLQIYHNSANHLVASENSGGDLRISVDRREVVPNPAATETGLSDPDGSVDLYYTPKNLKPLILKYVTGHIEADTLNVSGVTTVGTIGVGTVWSMV